MRLYTSALCATVAFGLLAGCSGRSLWSAGSSLSSAGAPQSHFINGRFTPAWSALANPIPAELRPSGLSRTLHALAGPMAKSATGIYASEFFGTDIYGYPNPNKTNHGHKCLESGVSNPNGIDVDGQGNLIDPDGGSRSVIVYGGPAMCGPELKAIADPYGQPTDASSANVLNDKIVVGNIFDTSGAGSVSVCTYAGGCTVNLTNPNIDELSGVAQAKNGDCWAEATDSGGAATLTYFKHCTGAGQTATGFVNTYYGGLDIDTAGHLVSISAFDNGVGAQYVYRGCKPACTRIGGPFPFQGESIFGHLNQTGTQFIAADFGLGQEDVYTYSPTSLTFSYSFKRGLTKSDDVEGAAFNPRSDE
jgi:hypothetical protein